MFVKRKSFFKSVCIKNLLYAFSLSESFILYMPLTREETPDHAIHVNRKQTFFGFDNSSYISYNILTTHLRNQFLPNGPQTLSTWYKAKHTFIDLLMFAIYRLCFASFLHETFITKSMDKLLDC